MKDSIFIGDWHMGVKNDSLDFLEYQMKFFESVLFPYCEANNIKRIIMAGDMFDKRKTTNTGTLHQFRVRVIEKLNSMGVTLVVLVGNHDIFYRDSLSISTPYEFFANRYKHIHIINEPVTTKIGNAKVDLIPWVCKDNIQQTMSFINNSTSDVAVGHFELNGFKFAKDGHVCDEGMSPNVLKSYKLVASGHFHTASDSGNVKYLGTPFQITRSDINDPKGFYLFDDETLDLEFVKNPFELFHDVVYDDSVESYTGLKISDFDMYKDSIVRITIKNSKSKAKFGKFKEMFYKVGIMDLNIVDLTTFEMTPSENLTVNNVDDTDKLIKESIKNVVAPNIDPVKLNTLMENIHKRALEKRSKI